VTKNRPRRAKPAETSTPKPEAPPRGKRRRLDPAAREREIVDGAVAFFAEVGFDGSLRDLAQRIGTTHQNLLRYFPTKEALIERVYREVYLNRWDPEWESLLRDPGKSLETRLIAFYKAYLPAIFTYEWVRIFVFAGLKGVGISQRYLGLIQHKVIEPLAFELRIAAGIADDRVALSPDELEVAWGLHGEIFYLAVRRWVYDMQTPDDLSPVIRTAVRGFLNGAAVAIKATCTKDK
jgi:AcrR family transcriptional regulator